MNHKKQKTSSRLTGAIVLLAVLLVLSCAALVGRYVYQRYFTAPAVATVPDNLIEEEPTTDSAQPPETSASLDSNQAEESTDTDNDADAASSHTTSGQQGKASGAAASPAQGTVPVQTAASTSNVGAGSNTQATVIELYKGRPDANQKFEVGNMFPGDRVTRYFCVRIYHDQPIEVFFRPEVTYQTQDLGNALQIAATRLGMGGMLCDDTFSQVSGHSYRETFQPNAEGVTVLYYRVEVYADTSMGNEYQQASLKADFDWYVQDEGQTGTQDGTQSGAKTGTTENEAVTTNALTLPQTGDPFNVLLWTILAVSALLLAVLLYIQRKKETKKHG